MDERLSVIFARRSVRVYTHDPVGESEIESLLEAGMAAPSANNRCPWQFVVVRDRSLLGRLAKVHPYAKMLAGAPLAIVVCGERGISDWWVQDCAAATENILIAAAALGLGAVWIGCHGKTAREEAVRRLLDIPAPIGVLSMISVGHPAVAAAPRTQYDAEKIHSNHW